MTYKSYRIDIEPFEKFLICIPHFSKFSEIGVGITKYKENYEIRVEDIQIFMDWLFDCETCILTADIKIVPKLRNIQGVGI